LSAGSGPQGNASASVLKASMPEAAADSMARGRIAGRRRTDGRAGKLVGWVNMAFTWDGLIDARLSQN